MPGAGSEHGRTQAREGARRGPRRGRASVRALGGSQGRARGTARRREGGVGRKRAGEEAAPTGKALGGSRPPPEEPRARRPTGGRFSASRAPGEPPAAILDSLPPPRAPPAPISPPRKVPGDRAGGAATRTPLGFLHSPLHRRRLPAQEPGSRLGARSALEGRGVANCSARPRLPHPPSYCQSPQRISLPALPLGAGLRHRATPTRQPQVPIGYRRIAQTALAFPIGRTVSAAPSRSRPSGAAHGRLRGCRSAGPFPSAVRGWEAGAEAEPPFQTAAEAPRRGWAPGHGLRREQVGTWPGGSPRGPHSGRSSIPGLRRPRRAEPLRAAPRRRFPQGRESATPPAPAARGVPGLVTPLARPVAFPV